MSSVLEMKEDIKEIINRYKIGKQDVSWLDQKETHAHERLFSEEREKPTE